MSRVFRKALLCGSTAITFSLIGGIAQAQDDPLPTREPAASSSSSSSNDEIIVTGTRLPRAGYDTVEPAVVLGSEQMNLRGYTTVGKALQELPAFGVPDSSTVGDQAGSFGSGQSFVNFFGLGSQRTLTLVNSRRFIGSNTASIFGPTGAGGTQVDLNLIPTLLVDRIETIAVGGAPIYGSDAIAGTVNIILKKNYEGFTLDGQYGLSSRGDADDWRIRGLAGKNFADGRGNITISGEYNRSSGLRYNDRKIMREGRFFTTPGDPSSPYNQELYYDRTLPGMSQYGIPLVSDYFALSPAWASAFEYDPAVLDGQGRALRFDPKGNLIPINFGTDTGTPVNSSGGNGFRLRDVSALLSPVERMIGTAQFNYELSDGIRFFSEAWFARTKGTELVDQPVYNSGLFGSAGDSSGNLIVPLSNPYLSSAARAAIQNAIATSPYSDDPNQDYFYLGRANTDLYSGRGSSTSTTYRFVAGFDGDIDFNDNKLHWEIVGIYGRSKSKGKSYEVVQQNFLNALNSTVDGSGNIVCAPGYTNSPIATGSSQCAPFNPFGQQISQAARDYITTIARPVSINTQKVFTANIGGNIFDLPGGKVGLVVGFEHREEKASFDPGRFFYGEEDPNDPTAPRTSYGRSIPIDPVSGKYKTNEFFAELSLPIIGPDMNVPGFHSLSAKGAIRWVDNSITGKATTWTAGGEWKPISDVAFRGNYTRSIRAPAVTELFAPNGLIFDTADDPCDSRFINGGPNPANRAANCAAAGITQPFTSLIVDRTADESLSGNPNLTNETANSWTIGAVFRPSFVRGLTASVDWVNIKLRDAVVSLDDDSILNACYDATSYPSDACGRIDRDGSGQITFVRTGYLNAASYKYAGLLAQLDYVVPTPFLGSDSAIKIGLNYSYIDKLETRVGTGDLDRSAGEIGYSKHKGTANLTYTNGGFSWLWQMQYYGPAKYDMDEAPNNRDYPKVSGVAFFNTTVAYDINDRFTVQLMVDNVFDKKPPFPSPGGGGSVTYFTGILGTYGKLGFTAKF